MQENHTDNIRQDIRNFFDIPMEERTKEDVEAVRNEALKIPADALDLYEDLMEAADETQQFLEGYEPDGMEG